MCTTDIPVTQTAARVQNPGPEARFVIQNEQAVPQITENQILVKLVVAGLCHSDLNRVYGTLPLISDIVGHEGVGIVVKAGSAATSHMINKRVGLGWLSRPCMECEICDVEYTSCPKQQNLGRDLAGTFQQYIAVDSDFVHPLPDNLPSEIAAPLLCAGISMYSAIRKCNLQTGNWLLIPGAGGGLGHLGVQIARAQGYRVIAVDIGEDKRRICLEFGAVHFIDYLTEDVPGEVTRLTSLGVHGVICTAGSIAAYQQAAQCSKRGKYISKACNECIYAPSTSTSQSASSAKVIRSLSQQVAQLQDNLQELRKDRRSSVVTAVSPGEGPESALQTPLRQPLSRHALSTTAQEDPADLAIHAHATPPTITPSSTGQPRQPAVNYTFNLELARQHLRAQGSRAGDSESSDPANPSEPVQNGALIAPDSWNFTKSTIDPLWLIDKQEALRLCHVYEEEIGNSYPFLTLSGLVENVHKLYDAMEAGSRSGFAFVSLPGPPLITADEIDILRLALSSAMTIETSGSSGLGKALFAIHSFLSGDDLQAWRLIGIPARSCLELGLHQATTYTTMFKEPLERKMAIRLFWSVHTLDRRWSFGAGLPFIIQSNDIDSNIPWPDDEVPYLHAMVAYNRIGAKVWATLYNAGSTASNVPRDEIEFLHYSVERWYKEIPLILKLPEDGAPALGRGHHRLQILLYLRACQMKILLHQSALHAIPRPARDTSQVQMLVSIAKDMIQKLHHLNQTTDIYQTQQVCFNHFLISALGVIFLAVALEPAVYRDTVRQEFNTALDLVRGFSKRSYVSRRLWKMIRGLQQAGVRLGISAPHQDGRTAQATPQATPGQIGRVPSPLILATPNPSRESPQASEAWLDNGIMADRAGGFGILDGMEMTVSLDDFLTAAENDNGLWGTSLSPEASDPLVQGTLNPSIDLAKLDFSQMLDSFL
ncbi:hypothetical protein HZS61_002661 [Fusarium oxysporum f. sp. conglutinans]|uniref:Enoyl reductase (ER) domain-containing protein n=1 Tax=Fusarium oxysporum f. sp. conglutinans TaxID=100902 RepID=A0A8H6LFK1_FUSOX|nr:hypothetical protein HZS61_002661 [Fusarium oxysporum f. sp. conglutinans]